jgi:uncharacterized membrane protein YqaE (UPF0057 family)
MKYVLAILLPPLAVLMCGKPIQAVLNFFLTLCFWLPGVIHAWYVVRIYDAQGRAARGAGNILITNVVR